MSDSNWRVKDFDISNVNEFEFDRVHIRIFMFESAKTTADKCQPLRYNYCELQIMTNQLCLPVGENKVRVYR